MRVAEDEIDKIIQNSLPGERKKSDLSYLRVHKFQLNNQLTLLEYSWGEDKIELYLLTPGTHENFYQEQNKQRRTDLKIIG